MPVLNDAILFLEDDEESQPPTFDRDLQSLLHQPGFEGVKGIVIGRFQKNSKMSNEQLAKIIETKRELAHIPVVVDADFGHTSPMFTFPIGGMATLHADEENVKLTITE